MVYNFFCYIVHECYKRLFTEFNIKIGNIENFVFHEKQRYAHVLIVFLVSFIILKAKYESQLWIVLSLNKNFF